MLIYLWNHDIYRFPIAIKMPKNTNTQEVALFLDEAKTMLEVGVYHEHIVNLQGIAHKKGEAGESFAEVQYIIYHLLNYQSHS